jgi:PAS domain S-box-containing protein
MVTDDSDRELILIADDHAAARELLRRLLEADGYRVDEAEDGAEALKKLVLHRPSVLLIDAVMPRVNGFDVCTRLQGLPAEQRVPVVMITALDDQASIDRAFEAGAVDYITKPVYWPVLRQRLRRLLATERAERALEERYNLLHTLIDNIPDYIFAKDREGRFTLSNVAHARAAQVSSPEALIGKTALDLFPPDVAPQFHADDQAIMQDSEALINVERLTVGPDGSERVVLTTKVPLRDPRGQVIGLVGISRDVTDRKRAQQELDAYRDHLEAAVAERTAELVAANDALQREIAARREAETRQVALTAGLRAVIAVADELMTCPDTDTLYRRAVELAREELEVERCAIFLERDGQLWGTYGTDDRGNTTDEHALAIPKGEAWIKDFRALPRHEQQRLVMDSTLKAWDGQCVTQVGHGWISVSRIHSAEDEIGVFFNDTAISLAAVDPVQQEVVTVFCSLLGHIIERKRIEETLQNQTAYLTALNQATVGVVRRLDLEDALETIIQQAGSLVGAADGYLYVVEPGNQELVVRVGVGRFESDIGYRLKLGEGLAGLVWKTGEVLTVDDYSQWPGRRPGFDWLHAVVSIPLRSGPEIVGVLGLAYSEPHRFSPQEVEILARFGELASIALHNSRLYAEIQQELLERRRAEESLRQSEERYRRLFDQIDDSILIHDAEGHILDVNEAACRRLGCPRDELLQMKTVDVDPDYACEFEQRLGQKPDEGEGMLQRIQGVHKTRDGRLIDVEVNPTAITYGGQAAVLAVCRDVTERNRVERELRDLNQLKTEFLSTAAHELRTPLTSILGFSELLLTRDMDASRVKHYLQLINVQSAQIGKLVDGLLDISRLESKRRLALDLQPVNWAELLDNVLPPFVESSPKHDFRVEGLLACPSLVGDSFRLGQVFQNLLSNAVKYSPRGGAVTIRGRVIPGFVEVTVQDEGIGITAQQQAHLFERFYRADASNTAVSGTGLGLAICKLIIELHGGQVWVESDYEVGTVVYFTLPLARNEVLQANP